jgi:hypothetical protein
MVQTKAHMPFCRITCIGTLFVTLLPIHSQQASATDAPVSAPATDTPISTPAGDAQIFAPAGEFRTIHNDVFWHDTSGAPLYSQGGGIFRFMDPATNRERYYWYGVRYTAAQSYHADPTVTAEDAVFDAVTCYVSDNLVDWSFSGDVLTRTALEEHGTVGWVGRLGVAKLPGEVGYAMLVQYGGGAGSGVLIATAQQPANTFRWHRLRTMTDYTGLPTTGDQTVFTDPDDGRSYLVYSYGRGRNRIYVSEIGMKADSVELLDCTEVYHGESREGNCMFKRGGKYYMCASNIYGWDGSLAYYLCADTICGPYTPVNDMQVMEGCEADYCHVSQTGFFYTLRRGDQETVLFCGDRWANFAGNGLGYNQWVPLSFDEEGRPCYNSLSVWALNEATGEWRVAPDNNYVRNGSFEADRRTIPNPVKPRQEYLSGWTTEVLRGNHVGVDSLNSPQLNYLNRRSDRREVTGEKSLYMSDVVPFTRRVSQVVTATPYVPLTDGSYTLCARVRHHGTFARLEVYAESGGETFTTAVTTPAETWCTVVVPAVQVKDGRAVVGFYAEGEADAACWVDDVSFCRD